MTLPADAPAPRLCLVEKVSPDQEYGYNLHAERGKDQFVGTVDKGSPADRAGLRMGDRIYAVNGVSIVGESHRKVVERIKEDPLRCELLVVDEAGSAWYKEKNITISPTMPNIIRPGHNNNNEKPSGSPPPAAWYAPAQSGGAKDPVFVAPPPPHDESARSSTMGGAPKPKPTLCHLEKRSPTDEFGFNLHAEKNKGHFIGAVDNGGIGDRAGLKMSQRIVGVNGVLIHPHTAHKEVVALIKKNPVSTTLLVAGEDVDSYYKQHDESYSFDYAEEGGVHHAAPAHTHHIAVFHEEMYAYSYDRDASRRGSAAGAGSRRGSLATRSRAPTADDIAAAVVAGITVGDVIVEDVPLGNIAEEDEHTQIIGAVYHVESVVEPYRPPAHTIEGGDDLMAAVFSVIDTKIAHEDVGGIGGGAALQHYDHVPDLSEEHVYVNHVEPAVHELETHHHVHEEHHLEHVLAEAVVAHEIDKIVEEELEKIHEHEIHQHEEHHHHHEEEHDASPHETPIMTPEPALRTGYTHAPEPIHHHIAEPVHVPKANGHAHAGPGALDIFELSAAEARERLRATNRRRDPRRLDMTLEEKYRIVSSM